MPYLVKVQKAREHDARRPAVGTSTSQKTIGCTWLLENKNKHGHASQTRKHYKNTQHWTAHTNTLAAAKMPDEASAATPITTATFLMHPLMVEISPLHSTWRSNARIQHLEMYSLGIKPTSNRPYSTRHNIREFERIANSIDDWMEVQGVGLYESRHALADPRTKRLWKVDFVCEIDNECCLVCLFHSRMQSISKSELEYAERLKKIARTTYKANVRVVILKVRPRDGHITTWEVGTGGRN